MKTLILSVLIIGAAGFFFQKDIAQFVSGDSANQEKNGNKSRQQNNASDVIIKQKWELPPVLIEISGLAWIDGQRFACVQDEAGTIYIYNTATASIEKEIPFTGAGDFEGIALNGNTAYIVRSDGVIFEVDMNTKKTEEYKTFLTASNNVETLFYEAGKNRLLLAGKDPDEGDPARKNIYAFDLNNKTLGKDPVFSIDLTNPLLTADGNGKKKKKIFNPSAIAIHPVSKDVYILDGPKSRLLVTSPAGDIKKLTWLGKEFFKPEGISFSPAGDLFISNEGKKIPGNIMEVML